MKKTKISTTVHTFRRAVHALAGAAMIVMVQAGPLTGSISMSTTPGSSWVGDGGNVNTIASILDFGVSRVDSVTGDFAGAMGGLVAWGQPLLFAGPSANNPLWTSGGFTFNADLAPLGVNRIDRPSPQPDTLSLGGGGVVSAPGFDDTVGGWEWSGTMNGAATFSFASTTLPITGVPDGGSTALMLAMGLAVLAGAMPRGRSQESGDRGQ